MSILGRIDSIVSVHDLDTFGLRFRLTKTQGAVVFNADLKVREDDRNSWSTTYAFHILGSPASWCSRSQIPAPIGCVRSTKNRGAGST